MSVTSFKIDEDLLKKIDKIKNKTGKSKARIINDAIRESFEKSDLKEILDNSTKLQHKILFVLKEVVKYREDGDEFIKRIEDDFERAWSNKLEKWG